MDLSVKTNILAIDLYNTSVEVLVQTFVKKYFAYDDDYYVRWFDDWWAPGTVGIWDYSFNISDMYIALRHDIPEKTLFDWYHYQMDTEDRKNPTNFISYYKGADEILNHK